MDHDCPLIPLLVSKATSLSYYSVKQGILHMVQIDDHVKDIMGSISFGNRWQPNNMKIDNIKEAFLAKEWNSFHVLRKKQDYLLHLKDFPKYKCELYLKQPLTPPQCKIIATLHHLEL
jgi:hypothetical protein